MKKLLTGASALALGAVAWSAPAYAECVETAPGSGIYNCTDDVDSLGYTGNGNDLTFNIAVGETIAADPATTPTFIVGNDFTFNNDGRITGDLQAIQGAAGTTTPAVINNNGQIDTTGNVAAIQVGANVTVNNGATNVNALIAGGTHGVLAGDGLIVNNMGSITGDNGVVAGPNATVSNSGLIDGALGFGVNVAGDFDVDNSGTISGANGFNGGNGTLGNYAQLDNLGTIDGDAGLGAAVGNFVAVTNGSSSVTGAQITGTTNGLNAGTDLDLTNFGTISGAYFGVVAGADAVIDNSGSISGTSANGMSLGNGFDVTNNTGGSISGVAGISGGSGTALASALINNQGTVTGNSQNGVAVADYVSITNGDILNTGAQISGQTSGIAAADFLSVDNFGSISGAATNGIAATDDVTIVNGSSQSNVASISGGVNGVSVADNLDLTNYGTISGTFGVTANDDAVAVNHGNVTGTTGAGAAFNDDFAYTNYGETSGATGFSGQDGASGDQALLSNYGTISGSTGAGADVGDFVTVNNGDGGILPNVISGATLGVDAGDNLILSNLSNGRISGGGGSVNALDNAVIDNSGQISTSLGNAITVIDDFDIDNFAGGYITAGGIAITGGGSDLGTARIRNSGTITSTDDAAIMVGNDVEIANLNFGSITGDDEGIIALDGLTVTNGANARIIAQTRTIDAQDTLYVSNAGLIQSNVSGDAIYAYYGQVDNSGTIRASSGGAGIYFDGGTDDSRVNNLSNGVIEGALGIEAGSYANAVLIDNRGTIRSTTGGTAISLDAGDDELINYNMISGDVLMGDGDDLVVGNSGAMFAGDIDTGADDDTVRLDFGSMVDGDIDTGSGDDLLALNTIEVTGTVDMGTGTNTLEVGPDLGYGMIAFSDNVDIYDGSAAPDYVLFTGDYLVAADPLAFAALDAMAARQTFQTSRSIMDASGTPGWYGQVSAYDAEDDLNGGDLTVGYNTDSFGAFLSWGKSSIESGDGLNDFDRRALTVGVKGFADLGGGKVTGMAFAGRGDTDIDGDLDLLGDSSMDDTILGLAARFDHMSANGLGFAAEVGASRIKHDDATAFGAAGVTVEERETTVSYLSLEASYDHALSGGSVLRPFVGATLLSADGDSVTLSTGANNSNAPTSTTFGTGGDDDLKMLRLGAELAGAGGWSAKLEGQFDDDGNTTGIVTFGMSF